jgi:hypothetical protein
VSRPDKSCYRCAPGIVWVRDAEQAILVDEERGRDWRLEGVEAAIWDWLAGGYDAVRIAHFLALATGIPVAEAWRSLRAVIEGWQAEGILEGNGCDQPGD